MYSVLMAKPLKDNLMTVDNNQPKRAFRSATDKLENSQVNENLGKVNA
jgi:hypothetical protein